MSYKGRVYLLEIKAAKTLTETKIGDSIAANGICLTVIKKEESYFSFEVMPETLKTTNLENSSPGLKVNLERALKVGDRLSGHFVTGHVDCIGLIRKKNFINNNLCFEIAVPEKFMKYVLPKGSIAVDGISLTIAEKLSGAFRVFIIPHTVKNTTLGFKGISHKVNIEFDILAKK